MGRLAACLLPLSDCHVACCLLFADLFCLGPPQGLMIDRMLCVEYTALLNGLKTGLLLTHLHRFGSSQSLLALSDQTNARWLRDPSHY